MNLNHDKYSVGSSLRSHVAYYLRYQGFAVIETLCDEGTAQDLECLRREAVDAVMVHEAGKGHDSWLVRLVATATGPAIAAVSGKARGVP